MLRILIISITLLFVLTCDTLIIQKDQALATKIVWNDVYGMVREAPTVSWVEGTDLNCFDGKGFKSDYSEAGKTVNGCVGGYFDEYGWFAEVAWWKTATFDKTAFAHELAHAYLYATTKDGDAEHKTLAVWGPGGLLEQANNKLIKAGL